MSKHLIVMHKCFMLNLSPEGTKMKDSLSFTVPIFLNKLKNERSTPLEWRNDLYNALRCPTVQSFNKSS
jgi:hypothetical protein